MAGRGASTVYERTPGCASAALARPYRRREPEKTALYALVAAELPALCAGLDDGRSLPPFVERELRGYLECGLLSRGFARVRCRDCKTERLVAFSCRGRGVCPSCTTRRMNDSAAHLVDRVIPRVPVRQWVITFPRRIRWHLAHDPKLAAEAMTACIRVVFAWQRRRARALGVDFCAPKRSQSARNAAVVFPQRFDSALALNFHIHALVADGVFERTDERPRFHRLPPPTDSDVTALLERIADKVVKLLRRRGRLHDAKHEPDSDPDPDDTLTWIHAAASRRLQSPRVEPPPPPLCARSGGFSLHAAIAVHENDREGLERLARYCARPALSPSRLSFTDDGLVRYEMKRTFANGQSEVLLEPRDFLVRLCALIPPTRFHMIRYYGAFGPSARDRAALAGRSPMAKGRTDTPAPIESLAPQSLVEPPPPTHSVEPATFLRCDLGAPPPEPDRPPRLDWAALLQRVHKIDVLACECGGRLHVIAFVTNTRVARKILDHLGIPVEKPALCPARAPPQLDLPGPGFDGIDPPSLWN